MRNEGGKAVGRFLPFKLCQKAALQVLDPVLRSSQKRNLPYTSYVSYNLVVSFSQRHSFISRCFGAPKAPDPPL